MPTFTYKAKNAAGEMVEGVVEAPSFQEAERSLVTNREIAWVVSIGEAGSVIEKLAKRRSVLFADFSRVTLRDLVVVCQQMSSLLNAGVGLLSAFDTILSTTTKQKLIDCLKGVRKKVEEGKSVTEAFGAHPDVFSPFFVNMVNVGETSGNLDRIFSKMAEYYEQVETVRRRVGSATTYPIFVIGIVAVLCVFVIYFLLPQFEKLYLSFKTELPVQTKVLLNGGKFVRANFVWLVLGIVGSGIAAFRFLKTPEGKVLYDTTMLRVPIFGPLFQKFNSLLFVRGLSIMANSGVTVTTALEIVAKVVSNVVFSKAILNANERIRSGGGIGQTFKDLGFLHPVAEQMVFVGEKSGALGDLLEKAGSFYEMEIRGTVDKITAAIEPALLVVLGVGIGYLVIALYLPMFNLARTIVR